MTVRPARAYAWSEERGGLMWMIPNDAEMVVARPSAPLILLPDWAQHPDADRIAEVFGARLSIRPVLH